MAMNCICCGKTFKYGWQMKENIGVCEDCIKSVEIHLNNASVELNDLKNTNTFEETKTKVISTLNAENDKETIEYLTALIHPFFHSIFYHSLLCFLFSTKLFAIVYQSIR